MIRKPTGETRVPHLEYRLEVRLNFVPNSSVLAREITNSYPRVFKEEDAETPLSGHRKIRLVASPCFIEWVHGITR